MVFIRVILLTTSASLISCLPTQLRGTNTESRCVHQFPLPTDVAHPVRLEPVRGRSRRSVGQKMSIKVFYHSSLQDLDQEKREVLVERIFPAAVEYWEDIITVEECVETKCGEFQVPEDHLTDCHTCDSTGRNCGKKSSGGPGVDGVDFVLYVSSITTQQCLEAVGGEAETVAYAAHCQQEESLDRPVAGHTNICPQAISSFERDILSLESTLKHELLHAFGFSSSLFAFFRDEEGRPRTARLEDGKPEINRELQVRQWSNNTIRTVQRPWLVRSGLKEKTTFLMVTPRVVEEVRLHFACPSLEGAELEDQGGDGTALTHWEKRIFQNEAMTGTVHSSAPVYSRLTLALLEDSGWYRPDYSRAQPLAWGAGAGCHFATKSCMELLEDPGTPFCSSLMQSGEKTSCTADLSSVGSCNMVQYSQDLPEIYQNFHTVAGVEDSEVGQLGSSVTLADFCPYIQEFTWRGGGEGAEGRGTRCANEENAPQPDNNYALETYGKSSRCFRQASKWEEKSCTMIKQWTRYGSGCYRFQCQEGRVNILVRNVSYSCSYSGQEIPVELVEEDSGGESWLHTGSVVCPACSQVCEDCREDSEPENHLDKRENLGDCFLQADNDAGNLLIGFLKEFGGSGFNLG